MKKLTEKEVGIKISKALRRYYDSHPHHTKGKPKSPEQKKKMSIARKKWSEINGFPEEIKRKISRTKKRKYKSGEIIPWNKGKKRPPFSKEWRENLSKALKGRKPSRKTIRSVKIRNKTNNPMWDPKIVKKAVMKRNYKEIARKTTNTKRKNGVFLEYSRRMKKNNPMWDPEVNKKVNKNPRVIKKRIESLIKKPNKKEEILLKIIKKHNLSYKYVGNGQKIIGTKNPDFIDVNGKKKIIELFGSYWHTKKARVYEETEEGRIIYFKKYGFDTLIIWEQELNDPNLILEKIKNFKGGV